MPRKPAKSSSRRSPTKRSVAPVKSADTKAKPIPGLSAMRVFAKEKRDAERILVGDGFDNFVSKVGLRNNNTLSAGTYEFDLITRNRIKLEAAYRGSWIVGALVDSVAEDMTRAGIDILTSKEDGDIKKIQSSMSKLQVWQSLRLVSKWGRLYGGSLGLIQIEGQKLSSPLNIESIKKGQFQGIVDLDRWMVNPILQDPIDSGPEMGLPKYYQIVNSPDEMSPGSNPVSINENTVHYTRVIRYTGIDLPYFQAITEMMWGESILERLWDRLIAFDNATMSAASLIDVANLRTIGVNGLREIIAAGGEAQDNLVMMFKMMEELQSNQRITLLDKDDTFNSQSYTFAGLADMLLQFMQQLSGAASIPLIRLIGQSPAGLNSTGDADIRMYYDMIKAQQESKFRNPMEVLLKVLWMSELGKPAPDDLEFEFTPLWQMTTTDKVQNAKTTAETVLGAYEAGVTKRSTTLSELRDSSGDTGIFSNITDKDISEADEEDDAPPLPGDVPPQTGIDPAAKDPKTEPATTPVKSLGGDSKRKWWHRK